MSPKGDRHAAKRVILEMGTGNDLHGGDYTKAALRAVQDAIHHSSLTMLRSLEVDAEADASGGHDRRAAAGQVDADAVKRPCRTASSR